MTDAGFRDLERLTGTGDPDAERALAAARARFGMPNLYVLRVIGVLEVAAAPGRTERATRSMRPPPEPPRPNYTHARPFTAGEAARLAAAADAERRRRLAEQQDVYMGRGRVEEEPGPEVHTVRYLAGLDELLWSVEQNHDVTATCEEDGYVYALNRARGMWVPTGRRALTPRLRIVRAYTEGMARECMVSGGMRCYGSAERTSCELLMANGPLGRVE